MFLIWIPGEVNKNKEKDRTGTLVYHVPAPLWWDHSLNRTAVRYPDMDSKDLV